MSGDQETLSLDQGQRRSPRGGDAQGAMDSDSQPAVHRPPVGYLTRFQVVLVNITISAFRLASPIGAYIS